MGFWETAHELPGLGDVELAWARGWRGAKEVVYSRTADPRLASQRRTRIERAFDPTPCDDWSPSPSATWLSPGRSSPPRR